ncbi:solute carrier family 40 member 1-like protein [Dinothrombium tinctorium]|uniref:Solute carrier family 40 member n=1 Tax=Dinothrombium tinctorium TaxID=1965070 RepID=A0A3S3S1G3_9ACAR|nr:solute carrier family 40 member 1-like protein [Dinothrombium tinctorium]
MVWPAESLSTRHETKNNKLSKKVLFLFYLNRVLSSWGDRTWQFAVGIYLIKLLPGSFFLQGIQGIGTSVAIILFTPIIGRWIERANRLTEGRVLISLTNGSAFISSTCVALYFLRDHFSANIAKIITQVCPLGLLIFSISAKLWSTSYTIALEKDWTIALATEGNELSNVNAMLRRIDLFCKIISPFTVGVFMTYAEIVTAIFLAAWNVFCALIVVIILKCIYYTGPNTIRMPKIQSDEDEKNEKKEKKFFDLHAFKIYAKQFFIPGLSYSLINYMTVLGLDSIAVGYLITEGVEASTVGTFSLISAVVGMLGTFCFPKMVEKLKLRKTGLIAYLLVIIPLTLCLAIFITPPIFLETKIFGIKLNIMLFLLGLIISRFGMWIADLTINQLIQTETSEPAVVGGVQTSLNKVMNLAKFFLVTAMPKVSTYWILVLISYAASCISVLFFAFFALRRKHKPGDVNTNVL